MNQTRQIQKQEVRKQSVYAKAQIIAASREIRKSVTGPMWLVESENVTGKFYKVIYTNDELMCDCPAFEYGMTVPCKHILSICIKETA